MPQPIAPGALGRDTPVNINADLLAYMQFGGYFAGVTIDDWIIGEMKESSAARVWRDALADYFRDMS